ncbi:hypothetical protein VNI00_000483 [Paramarasmius palmivorus]|uniref:Cleavage stimulation factor subunit 2 hinge domain-containing protein n=1 Tax=Paramarasmius palmivorus TaxID=297713 RepID=A0AAW0E5T9_9AGAR
MSTQETANSVNQLIELIMQLKKTTPAAAKQILNSQPQIAYAVMTLLVNMNAINVEVLQKTLTAFAQSQAAPAQPPAAPVQPQPTTQATAAPAIPPHMQQQAQPYYNRTATPPTSTPTPPVAAQASNPYSNGYQQPPQGHYGYNAPPPPNYGQGYNQGYGQGYGGPGGYGGYPPPPQGSYGAPTPAPAPAPTPQQPQQQPNMSQINPAILAALPEDQKTMVMHVLSMTPDMINRLPPQDRTNILQLRATLGL